MKLKKRRYVLSYIKNHRTAKTFHLPLFPVTFQVHKMLTKRFLSETLPVLLLHLKLRFIAKLLAKQIEAPFLTLV